MVIVLTAERAGLQVDDAVGEAIAARIEALVEAGRLQARGTLANWRRSEVRLPPK